ncbi:ABC transporter permease [Nocardioides sp.]|uniref:ABC transporter permease n=1 Tax=Nocardioides sp. TaxID=35761 RepID=UPI003D09D6AC
MRLARWGTIVGLALGPVLVLAVFFVLPVSGMLARGLWPDGHLDLGGVLEVLARPRVHRVMWFTLWSATLATVLTLLLGMPAAFVLHRLRFPGVRVLRSLLLVPFVLPTVVVGVAFRQLISEGGPLGRLNLDGSASAIIAALVFFNVAVVIRAVGTAWEGLDPRPAEAAAALGASPLRVLCGVTLPMLRPAIVSAATVVFLFCATAFGVVLTLGGLRYSTIETEIYLLTTQLLDLRAAAALSLLQLLTVTGLLVVAHRARRDVVVARSQPRARRPRRGDLPALAVVGLVLALVALPLGTLLAGSLTVDGEWSWGNYTALSTTGQRDAILVPVTDALVNSLRIALDATWMSLLLGMLVSLVVTRRSHSAAERRVRAGLDGFFMLPLGVSAVTLGFGFLITLDRPPLELRDSPLLVPIAQALVALPLVVRTIAPVLSGVDDRQRQAAASLGAPPWRAVLTVDLPVVWKPLLAAAGFAFATSLGEFGATSFLAREDHPTLPIVIYRLLGHPGPQNYGMALAASVVLALTTAVVMFAVERLRVRSVGAF